ncbi:MAG: hypothetical protein KAR16_09150 [Bacteroidales bacterium]|nr:hypothetical protein [Bacteroidales bacterium]
MFAAGLAGEKRSFGFQVWTIRKELISDLAGTLKKMAAMGYTEVEMCSPLGYSMAGFKPQDYFRNYPGRFISAHLADYSTKLEKQVPIGQGIVDWEDLFEAAKTGGVKNYFVEMDPETFEKSAKFLLG